MGTLHEKDVDELLLDAVPEFASAIREYRATWPDQPMLYPLIAQLFDFAVETMSESADVAMRAYSVVENVMINGSKEVKNCFAIEMLEPLVGDSHHEFYPNLEAVMGPATKHELDGMRKWWTENQM